MLRFACLPALALAITACSDGEAPVATDTSENMSVEAPANPPSPTREDDIRHFLLQEFPDAAPMQYALAWNDLDGDGTDEAIIYLVTPYFCGTGGCNTLVLAPAGPMWSKVAEISVSRTPISVLTSKSNGWKDLVVSISGGGGPSGRMVLKYDGKSYPMNPTVAPATPTEETGTELIGADPVLTTLEAVTPGG